VAVLIAVSTSHSGSGGATSTSTASSAPASVSGAAATTALFAGIQQHGTTLGTPNAPVKVVEFADLQCPFCRDYSLTQMPSIVRNYVKPARVSMEFQSLAFIGPDSVRAARVAQAAASQGKLWNFVDLMYRNQGKENSGYVTEEFIESVARAAGVKDIAQFNRERKSKEAEAEVERTTAQAAKLGFSGTPSFAITGPGANGLEVLRTPESVGEFDEAIEQAS
jgi:protein-disulfide isomerase